MSSPQQSQPSSFSLFPGPHMSNSPQPTRGLQGRRSVSLERRPQTPQEARAVTPDYPQTQQRAYTPVQPEPVPRGTPSHWPLVTESSQRDDRAVAGPAAVQQPRDINDVPVRTETAFSEANTLVRSNSGRSRSSMAKHPPGDSPSSSGRQPLRSMFPTYNPNVPLSRQEYGPTQMSPTHIPRAAISRQSVYEEPESPARHGASAWSPPSSPSRPADRGRWPLRIQTQLPPAVPKPCTSEDLKGLWRVANGWKASVSESRVFCLKWSQQKDAPVYTLSSAASHPFWNLRLDPTSASAYISLTRHDPSKPYKAPRQESSSPSSSSNNRDSRPADTKHWYEALTSTLEEDSRRLPPNDGLVALLMPVAATKMALEKADDAASVAAAENECARLVWDEDTATHFLVHNALSKPFCVMVERNSAYSRVEYTLEHNESPKHIAKLTRDGTGGGWIELDTGVAAQINSFYILDVVVAALLLVAAVEDRTSQTRVASFEPPPPAVVGAKRNSGRLSRLSVRKDDRKKRKKMEAFEIDVESQNDSLEQ
ncbi:hypothetical protein NOR_05671 [Metarhizium rileyi]|uniref:Acetylserotonin methytransferase-like protein n=1 Tax=Metarhizium rileyi (strain RCEF 4871) TaxID=1649241 RepID=A0A162JDA8_METRR|nr:hypothetical protein NOR_05671 [Metarhizium rileyi RCEF 4871]